MRVFTYDFEVFAHDWMITFKERGVCATDPYTQIHNNNAELIVFMQYHGADSLFFSANGKHYDKFIMMGAVNDFTPEELKAVNDWIIGGGQGWECPLLENCYFQYNDVDLFDDMQVGLSLKSIEAHFGMDIVESEVDFNIDRPLTDDEITKVAYYNKKDVDATEKLIDIRAKYLETKVFLGQLKGIPPVKALSMTNAKLTAAYLDAEKQVHDDERKYVYPTKLLRQYIPQDVFDFFNRIYDKSIPDDEVFSSKLKFKEGDCEITLGFGGIHGAIPFYREAETENRIIRNYDVGSYYPHLMTLFGYTSRSIPDPKIYENMLETRMKAKKAGDKKTANALKLPANTTYGAMLNQYNELYDPLMGRSVCITGQLFLLELAEHMLKNCPTLKIIQLNTDGIMVSFDTSDSPQVNYLVNEWQERTGFELEEDKIKEIIQKDVNNYIEIPCGELYNDKGAPNYKIKGGYLVRGIAPAGAFNVNNNAPIIAKAIIEYFIHGRPVGDTILCCDDMLSFQLVAKASSKYSGAYQIIDNEEVPTQKVNRVYASKDTKYGTLYKIKKETGAVSKIPSLPAHCIIDNDNRLDIKVVDKLWYINEAVKKINDFKGIKPEKKNRRKNSMAEEKITKEITEEKAEPKKTRSKGTTPKTAPKSVYAKLILARKMLKDTELKKSGKNMQLTYTYFELADFVPTCIDICAEVGLLPVTTFDNDMAVMTIYDVDNPEQTIVFTSPMREIDPIVSRTKGTEVTNAIQRLGSVETYERRYLYMIVFDIVEKDSIEPATGGFTVAAPTAPITPITPVKNVAPVNKQTPSNIKLATPPVVASTVPFTPPVAVPAATSSMTDSKGVATELQINQLKSAIEKLIAKFPEKKENMERLAVDTNSFKTLTKGDCEDLTKQINDMLNGGEK